MQEGTEFRPAQVLVVDDETALLELTMQIMANEGHRVKGATDGRQALALIGQETFDVVVLDAMMPNVDGFTVLTEMKASGALRTTRVLMLTSLGKDSDWLKGFKAGAHDYLTKPYDHDELVAAVKRLIDLRPEDVAAYREARLVRARMLAQLESIFGP